MEQRFDLHGQEAYAIGREEERQECIAKLTSIEKFYRETLGAKTGADAIGFARDRLVDWPKELGSKKD